MQKQQKPGIRHFFCGFQILELEDKDLTEAIKNVLKNWGKPDLEK